MVITPASRRAAWTIGAASLLASVPSSAQTLNGDDIGSFGGDATIATDYIFRGISNSNEKPQVQVDFSWAHPNGLYAGIWTSNTNFGGAGNSIEFDPYIGYANAIEDTAWRYDVGYWMYTYPGSDWDFDYSELYAIGTWSEDEFSVSPSVWYADNYFGDDFLGDASGMAYQVEGAWELPRDLEASAAIGQQTFGSDADEFDYPYYNVGITKTLGDWSLDLRYHDANDVEPGFADPDLADGALVFGVTRSF